MKDGVRSLDDLINLILLSRPLIGAFLDLYERGEEQAKCALSPNHKIILDVEAVERKE